MGIRQDIGAEARDEDRSAANAIGEPWRLSLAEVAELQNQALHQAPMGMFVKDADDGFRYVDVNDFFLTFVGLRREDVIGRRDSELWTAEQSGRYLRNDKAALERHEPVVVRELYRSPEGHDRLVQTLRCPVRSADGRRYVVGYWIDVSKSVGRQRRMLQELDDAVLAKRSEAFVARLLKGVVTQPLGMDPMDYLLEQIGRELQVDRCYIYTCKPNGGSWLTDHVYEWCGEGIKSERENLIRKGPPGLPDFCDVIDAGEDFVFSDTEGLHPLTRAWFEGRGVRSFFSTPIKDEKGVSVGYLGLDYVRRSHPVFSPAGRTYAHEAGSVVDLCYMRQRAIDDARRAERARSDFFASVSHDIRTPLNSIIGFSELLRTETDPARRAEYLDDVSFSSNALLELINDVLDLSLMDAGKLKLNRAFFDFRRHLLKVLRAQNLVAKEKGIQLLSRFEGDIPCVYMDERRVRQVLFNIVGNAVKYTDKGRVEVCVTFVRETSDRGSVRFVVSDTGIGIAAKDIPRLMQPYVRIQAGNARGGTGLGLSICKRLVEQAGGRITIESKLGEGSVVTIVMPNIRYRERTGDEEGEPLLSVVNVAVDLSGLRVLIVDDLEINCKVLAATCRQLGVRNVTAVDSGKAALAFLDGDRKVDVVFTDMKMPDMSGGELIRAMRQDPNLSRLPAYLVTADVAALKYASEVGAAGVLLKPIVRARLREVLVSIAYGVGRR